MPLRDAVTMTTNPIGAMVESLPHTDGGKRRGASALLRAFENSRAMPGGGEDNHITPENNGREPNRDCIGEPETQVGSGQQDFIGDGIEHFKADAVAGRRSGGALEEAVEGVGESGRETLRRGRRGSARATAAARTDRGRRRAAKGSGDWKSG